MNVCEKYKGGWCGKMNALIMLLSFCIQFFMGLYCLQCYIDGKRYQKVLNLQPTLFSPANDRVWGEKEKMVKKMNDF